MGMSAISEAADPIAPRISNPPLVFNQDRTALASVQHKPRTASKRTV